MSDDDISSLLTRRDVSFTTKIFAIDYKIADGYAAFCLCDTIYASLFRL